MSIAASKGGGTPLCGSAGGSAGAKVGITEEQRRERDEFLAALPPDLRDEVLRNEAAVVATAAGEDIARGVVAEGDLLGLSNPANDAEVDPTAAATGSGGFAGTNGVQGKGRSLKNRCELFCQLLGSKKQ